MSPALWSEVLVKIWIVHALITFCGGITAFVLGLRSGQFSNPERSARLPLECGGLEPDDAEWEQGLANREKKHGRSLHQ